MTSFIHYPVKCASCISIGQATLVITRDDKSRREFTSLMEDELTTASESSRATTPLNTMMVWTILNVGYLFIGSQVIVSCNPLFKKQNVPRVSLFLQRPLILKPKLSQIKILFSKEPSLRAPILCRVQWFYSPSDIVLQRP